MEKTQSEHISVVGFCYGLAAYTVWGFLPLYWKLLQMIPSTEILAHRIFWSFFYVIIILSIQGKGRLLKETLMDKRAVKLIAAASVLITVNWGLYIWAVNNNHVVESSMGYYINPLIVVLLGTVVLKEKLNFWQIISLVFAVVGVLILTIQYGKFPWVSLLLALSFALYGLFKKLIQADSLVGLALETMLIMPFAMGFILIKQGYGTGVIGAIPLKTTILLLCSGLATATPLLWFAKGAKRIPLSTMGFLQYISPTISLLLGILVFKESFTGTHLISFGFIWCGLIIYSLSQLGIIKNRQKETLEKYS